MHLSMLLCTLYFDFFSKSDHKILSFDHFKIIAQECSRGGEGIDPKLKLKHKSVLGEVKVLIQNILFHCFTSQLLLKLAF